MKPLTGEHAAKSQIIDGRIQLRYEELTGRLIQGDKLKRVLRLPLEYLARLADALDSANPEPKNYHQSPSLIVETVVAEHSESIRAKERAELDASGVVARMEMTIK